MNGGKNMEDIDKLNIDSIEQAKEIINESLFKPFHNANSMTPDQRRLLVAVSYLMHALDDYRWYEGEIPTDNAEDITVGTIDARVIKCDDYE